MDQCEYCGRPMEHATVDNLDGLHWLDPAEKWICPTCLKTEINKVKVHGS